MWKSSSFTLETFRYFAKSCRLNTFFSILSNRLSSSKCRNLKQHISDTTNKQGVSKKTPEGLKRQALIIIGTLPWLNAATNARTEQRLQLLQSDGKANNAIGSSSFNIMRKLAESWRTQTQPARTKSTGLPLWTQKMFLSLKSTSRPIKEGIQWVD